MGGILLHQLLTSVEIILKLLERNCERGLQRQLGRLLVVADQVSVLGEDCDAIEMSVSAE